MHFNVNFAVDNLKLVLGPNKIIKMKIFKFCFYFCIQYVLIIPPYFFE